MSEQLSASYKTDIGVVETPAAVKVETPIIEKVVEDKVATPVTETPTGKSFEDYLAEKSNGKYKKWEELETDLKPVQSEPLKFANEKIKTQAPMDVYAPLREAALFEGRVALIGVGLNRMTALHLAEQMAGRRMFVRWANGADKKPAMVETGGCSEGFCNLDPYVNHLDKKAQCGESPWRVFPMDKLLKQAARVIQLKPGTTHCGDPECLRCSDMAKGGPVL